MRRKKLGIYGITLVILAGLFQLITLSLDQLVIQLEENSRVVSDKISKKTYEQSFYLENNRKIGDIIRSSSFKNIIISSADYGKEYVEYEKSIKYTFYRSVLKSHAFLVSEIFSDESVRNNLCKKKKFRDITPIDQFEFISDKVLDVEVCPRFTSINDAIAKWINHLDSNEGKNIDYEQVQMNIDYNEYYLDFLLKYFGNMESKVLEDLYNFNNRQYTLNQKKQLYLLFSMVAQLVSFLFLLLLFRRILK